ncbi:putative Exocyst complex component Sec3 [Trypanosoma cruzi]|nr:putative Exocyst complex component Sec3 [Trypanosoma cruzi]
MATTGDELRSLVELVFRQRHEEVLTCESVVVIGRGASNKGSKARLLALCRPFAPSTSSSPSSVSQTTLNVVRVESGRVVKVKLVFVVARLVDVSHDGSFDATFNFGGSGMISVAFESHIQREMFVAAVRKVQRDLQPHVATVSRDVRALLTDALGAEVEADAAARVKSLRHEKRRALTAEDEQRLQHFLGRHGFDDIRSTEKSLSMRQKEAELSSVEVLLASVGAWEVVRSRIVELVGDVEELESRIAQYSRQILSKKEQLQRIEHQSNTLQRKQRNLRKLHEHLEGLCGQLSLPPQTTALLLRLASVKDEDLVDFFAEGNNAQVLSVAMKHMRSLLQNKKLGTDYPITAVAERRAFFIEQRRMIAHRSKAYILATIGKYETTYLADRTRYSSKERLVWRIHSELMAQLANIRDVITALLYIDLEGYIAVLRRYRVSMQRIYALEMQKFFKHVRTHVKKVGSRGPFLLGTRDYSMDEALNSRMETTTITTAAGGETPRRLWGVGSSVASTPAASWTLTPHTGEGDGGEDGTLCLELPTAREEGLRLYDVANVRADAATSAATPGATPNAIPAAATSYSFTSLASGWTGTFAGKLRPDLALAMVLETTFSVVLKEKETLQQCFGIIEKAPTEDDTSGLSRPLDDDHLPACEENAAKLLNESLLELFGGDKLVQFPPSKAGASSSSYSWRQDGDVGLIGVNNNNNKQSCSSASGNNAVQTEKGCYLLRQLVGIAEYCGEKCDRLYAVPVMAMLGAYRRDGTPTAESSFCQMLLQALEHVVSSTISRSIAEQTTSIATCRKRHVVDPRGMLSCFTKLPVFIHHMETVHNALPPAVCNRSKYASITLSFVDQTFEALNYITNFGGTEPRREKKLSFIESIEKRASSWLGGLDNNPVKRGIIQQYRHHAFFCTFYTSLPSTAYAVELLRERYESSRRLRDHYEEVYLTRILLVKDFPEFGNFALVAEDLAQSHSREELRHHNALSVEAMGRILQCLPREVRSGISSSSRRMKKHFLRDVADRKEEKLFHCALLQHVWQHFSTLLLQKIEFLETLLRWPLYAGMEMTITRAEVLSLLQAA